MTVANPSKSWRGAVARFSTTGETKKEVNAGTFSSTKVRGKEAATENVFVLLRQPHKLAFGEAMKEQNVVSKFKKKKKALPWSYKTSKLYYFQGKPVRQESKVP